MTWTGNPRTTSPAWRRLRRTILERDHHRCTWPDCDQPATEVDHIISHANGGTDDPTNLRSLCHPHHQAKSTSEGHTALAHQRALRRRPPEPHPGFRPPAGEGGDPPDPQQAPRKA